MRLIALFFLAMVAVNEAAPSASAADPVTLNGCEQFDLKAKSGDAYRIFVAAPTKPIPETGYPVIYLSDGNGNFPTLVAAVKRLALLEIKAVVVGIGYPDEHAGIHLRRRCFDLTPVASEKWLATVEGNPLLKKTGGTDEFLAFLEGEVKPRIEKKHPIDRKRQTLFGHSLGGLFALHVLFTKPEAFQTYVASSPSIWWDDLALLETEKAFVKKHADKGVNARLLMTVGEWEQKPNPKYAKELAKALKDNRQVTNAREMAVRLQEKPLKGLKVEFREFGEEDHGSVLLAAASRGVRFAMDELP